MSKLAADHDAINLSQGYPDFPTPGELLELVNKALLEGHNQYPPMAGIEQLRSAIAAKVEACYGAKVDANSEVTVVSGATEGLFDAIFAIIHPGDEVIIFDPAYDSYEPVIRLAGGAARRVPMRYPAYDIDWDEVHDTINEKTRMIMVNSPHNPTGTILAQADIDALIDICVKRDLFIISDEVYEHIVFDGMAHLSMLRFPKLRERAFVISSFGKTYHATGWKVGYCIAPRELTAEYRKIHQFNTFTTSTPMQYALAWYMEHREHYLGLPAFYQAKRDHLRHAMADSRFRALDCRGTYFQLFDYSDISKENDFELVKRLTREYGVAAIPVSVFYRDEVDNKVIRLCFAKDDRTLSRAAEILCKI